MNSFQTCQQSSILGLNVFAVVWGIFWFVLFIVHHILGLFLVIVGESDVRSEINPFDAIHDLDDYYHPIIVWFANVLCSPYYYVELLFAQVAGLFVVVKDTNSG